MSCLNRRFAYSQNYSYHALNNLTSRFGTYYYQSQTSDSATFLNNRRQDPNWSYYADGQVKHSPLEYDANFNESVYRDWSYDAAGRMVQVQETLTNPSSVSTYKTSYDGDGQPVRESTTKTSSNTTGYMIRSSVLGGRVLTRLDSSGNKLTTVVNVDGRLMAVQSSVGGTNSVSWTHVDPLGLSEAGDIKSVYDPLGNYIPWQQAPSAPPNAYPPFSPNYGGQGSSFGASRDKSCVFNGMPITCTDLAHRIDIGNVAAEYLIMDRLGLRHVQGNVTLLGAGLFQVDYPMDDREGGFYFKEKTVSLPQNPTYSSGGQLSPCLRDALRQFFPAMKVHGRSYSPADDARFKSGIPSVLNIAQENNAVTLGLYDIHFNPRRVNLNGGNFDSLDTIVEEVAHTVQFLQTWAKQPQAIYIGHDLGGYDAAKAAWSADYAYYSAKGRLQNGDAYKNDVEKWAKNRKFDILSALLSDKKLVQQGNLCGYDLTNHDLERPDW